MHGETDDHRRISGNRARWVRPAEGTAQRRRRPRAPAREVRSQRLDRVRTSGGGYGTGTASSTGRNSSVSPKQAGPNTARASGVRMISGVEMPTTTTRWP